MKLIVHWAINALVLMGLPYLLEGIKVNSFYSALIAALVLGLLNALIRPLLIVLTLPLTLVTLGAFILVINGLLFWFASSFLDGFQVGGFWDAFWGAVLYSLFTWAIGSALRAAFGR